MPDTIPPDAPKPKLTLSEIVMAIAHQDDVPEKVRAAIADSPVGAPAIIKWLLVLKAIAPDIAEVALETWKESKD